MTLACQYNKQALVVTFPTIPVVSVPSFFCFFSYPTCFYIFSENSIGFRVKYIPYMIFVKANAEQEANKKQFSENGSARCQSRNAFIETPLRTSPVVK